jgi:mRNA interferase MazF
MKYRRRLHKFRIGGNNIDTDRRSKENHERNDREMLVKRGEIYYADLSPVVGSEQGGVRPVLIVQNDVGNKHSPTVIAAAITSQKDKSKLPTHISLNAASCGLAKDSIVLLEQVRTLDKKRLKERMGELDSDAMSQVNTALSVSFGL